MSVERVMQRPRQFAVFKIEQGVVGRGGFRGLNLCRSFWEHIFPQLQDAFFELFNALAHKLSLDLHIRHQSLSIPTGVNKSRGQPCYTQRYLGPMNKISHQSATIQPF